MFSRSLAISLATCSKTYMMRARCVCMTAGCYVCSCDRNLSWAIVVSSSTIPLCAIDRWRLSLGAAAMWRSYAAALCKCARLTLIARDRFGNLLKHVHDACALCLYDGWLLRLQLWSKFIVGNCSFELDYSSLLRGPCCVSSIRGSCGVALVRRYRAR